MLAGLTGFANQRTDGAYGEWAKSVEKAVMRLDPQERTAGPIPTFSKMFNPADIYAAPSSGAQLAPENAAPSPNEEYGFADVIDIINPLQHLPVIGSFYRNLTGDTIKGMSAILGGALFGGPIGAVVSTADVIVRDRTGMDSAENIAALAGLEPRQPHIRKPDIVYAPAQKHAAAAYEAAGSVSPKNFAGRPQAASSWNS